jgi:prolyl oligopeptidase
MDAKPDKPIPTFIYVYGGFGMTLDLSFSHSRMLWMKHYGGMYVQPAIRGGGEFGEKWHL